MNTANTVMRVAVVLATIGVVDRWGKYKNQEETSSLTNLVALILSLYLFDDKYLLPVLLLTLAVSVLCIGLRSKYMRKYTHFELKKLKEMNNMLLFQNSEYERNNESLTNLTLKLSGQLDSSKANISSLFVSMYKEFNGKKDVSALADICVELAKKYEEPTVVWTNLSFDTFNQLNNERDIKRALKKLKEFKEDNYFGDGFDRDIDHYMGVLEVARKNVTSRVK